MYLSDQTSQQLWQAAQARRNRQDIVKAPSHGQMSRLDLVKRGLFTAGGGLALQNGLSPFVCNAYGEIPTGVPSSRLFGAVAFECPIPRCDLMMVNLTCKPHFYVERRKYRFRFLNTPVACFFKLSLSNGAPMIPIGMRASCCRGQCS